MRKIFHAALLTLALPMMALAAPPRLVIPPIFFALDDTNLEKARAIIAADPKAVNARTVGGVTPLEFIANVSAQVSNDPMAIMQQRIKEADNPDDKISLVAKLLVAKGADVNAKDDMGDTPLMYAINLKKAALANWLINQGADIYAKDRDGHTPLLYACDSGQAAFAGLLIYKGASVRAAELGGKSLLLGPVLAGQPILAQLLITNGANVNMVISESGWKGSSLLHVAALYGHTNLVAELLSAGAKVDATNNLGQTPLFLAAKQGQFLTVGWLLENGAKANARDTSGGTPLKAAEEARRGVAKHLDGDELDPFYNLADLGFKKTIKLLKKHGGTD